MKHNRDASALLDIYNAAGKIIEFSRDFDQKAFFADARTQSAILHQLLIIWRGGQAPFFRISTESLRNTLDPDGWNA